MERENTHIGMSFVQGMLAFIWALGTPAGWAAFYMLADERFSEPSLFLDALKTFSIPYLIFSIAVLVVIVFGANMRSLVEIKRTIDAAPKNLREALESADHIKLNIENVASDFKNRMEESIENFRIESELIAERLRGARPASLPEPVSSEDHSVMFSKLQLVPKTEMLGLLTLASNKFYDALTAFNSDKRRSPLTVSRGGGNRPDIAAELRDKDFISEAEFQFVNEVFRQEMSHRRKETIPRSELKHMDRLREKAGLAEHE